MSVFNDIFQGVGDVSRAGFADVQNHYAQAMWGTPAPQTSLTADMEYVTTPQEGEPQSYSAALRTHTDMEQAEIRTGYEAGQGPGPAFDASPSPAPDPAPVTEASGYAPEP